MSRSASTNANKTEIEEELVISREFHASDESGTGLANETKKKSQPLYIIARIKKKMIPGHEEAKGEVYVSTRNDGKDRVKYSSLHCVVAFRCLNSDVTNYNSKTNSDATVVVVTKCAGTVMGLFNANLYAYAEVPGFKLLEIRQRN